MSSRAVTVSEAQAKAIRERFLRNQAKDAEDASLNRRAVSDTGKGRKRKNKAYRDLIARKRLGDVTVTVQEQDRD